MGEWVEERAAAPRPSATARCSAYGLISDTDGARGRPDAVDGRKSGAPNPSIGKAGVSMTSTYVNRSMHVNGNRFSPFVAGPAVVAGQDQRRNGMLASRPSEDAVVPFVRDEPGPAPRADSPDKVGDTVSSKGLLHAGELFFASVLFRTVGPRSLSVFFGISDNLACFACRDSLGGSERAPWPCHWR